LYSTLTKNNRVNSATAIKENVPDRFNFGSLKNKTTEKLMEK